jgi:phosphoribosylanthranilate isomerase
LCETVLACRLDWVQLSGREPAELAAAVSGRIIKAVHVSGPHDLIAVADYPADAFLLDAPTPGDQMGGTGKAFDWSAAEKLPWPRSRVIVAGGLTPDNVGSAIERLRPGGVDVSSGVETGPGEKSPEKMETFLAAVSEADNRLRGTAEERHGV